MKVWIAAISSLILGAMLGVGSVWFEFGTKGAQFEPHNQRAGSTIPRIGGPKAVVVGGAEYNFGVGQRNSKMKHTFVIRNNGNEPLTLEKGETTCKCALSRLEDDKLMPGQTANVLLDWKLDPGIVADKFRQTAEIHTNDPNNETIRLVIFGSVVDRVKLVPHDIVLSSVPLSEGITTTFLLLGFTTETLKVVSHKFTNEESAEFFDLTFQDAPVDTVQEHENAQCGLVCTLTVKPGLPLGPINQTIHITTDVKDVGTLDMTVTGSVVSDISILGSSRYRHRYSLLNLGTVDRSQGIQEDLRILVKGPHRRDVRMDVTEVTPKGVLAATVDEPKPINDGAVYMHMLRVVIERDARPINCLGKDKYGKISITTTHPEVETIPIYVNFSVR